MEYLLRPVVEEEWPAYVRAVEAAFGDHPDDEDITTWRSMAELDRTLAAFDGDQIIGNAGAFSQELTVPGDAALRMAGVTAVGVRSTHRRKGVLTNMMRAQLDDVVERGEPIAALYASESVIYGRFGYGLASLQNYVEIETHRSAFRDDSVEGRLEVVDATAAAKVFPQVHDRARSSIPGDVNRSDAWWARFFKDREKHREGASALFYVVHESAPGEPDGYAAWRIKQRWDDGLAGSELRLTELYATTPAAHKALWRQVLDVDLVGRVTAWKRPVDEPLRWWLADPRQLKVKAQTDELWLRLLDIPACLSARRYRVEGKVVLHVADAFRPDNSGRYALDAGPEGAECRRTDADPDLSLEVADLGAVYLGGVLPSTLARAGRVVEDTPGALMRADAMFGWDRAPYCGTMF